MKVVLDTNIFVSGIFWKGSSNNIILAWKQKKFTLVSSLPVIEELRQTLKTFRIGMSDEMIEEWTNIIIENSIIVRPMFELHVVKEDPNDNKFIECAVAGKADYIVSQDKHLLKIGEYENIKTIHPKEFLKILK